MINKYIKYKKKYLSLLKNINGGMIENNLSEIELHNIFINDENNVLETEPPNIFLNTNNDNKYFQTDCIWVTTNFNNDINNFYSRSLIGLIANHCIKYFTSDTHIFNDYTYNNECLLYIFYNKLLNNKYLTDNINKLNIDKNNIEEILKNQYSIDFIYEHNDVDIDINKIFDLIYSNENKYNKLKLLLPNYDFIEKVDIDISNIFELIITSNNLIISENNIINIYNLITNNNKTYTNILYNNLYNYILNVLKYYFGKKCDTFINFSNKKSIINNFDNINISYILKKKLKYYDINNKYKEPYYLDLYKYIYSILNMLKIYVNDNIVYTIINKLEEYYTLKNLADHNHHGWIGYKKFINNIIKEFNDNSNIDEKSIIYIMSDSTIDYSSSVYKSFYKKYQYNNKFIDIFKTQRECYIIKVLYKYNINNCIIDSVGGTGYISKNIKILEWYDNKHISFFKYINEQINNLNSSLNINNFIDLVNYMIYNQFIIYNKKDSYNYKDDFFIRLLINFFSGNTNNKYTHFIVFGFGNDVNVVIKKELDPLIYQTIIKLFWLLCKFIVEKYDDICQYKLEYDDSEWLKSLIN